MAKKFRISDVKKAVEGSYGILSTIASRLGCDWHTAKKYIELYPDVKLKFEDEFERTGDFAESCLIKKIQEGDTAANIFLLKTKYKNRGYVERAEVKHDCDYVINFIPKKKD